MLDTAVAFGAYRLDLARRALTLNGKRVVLGGRALDILCALAEAGGEPIEKRALLAKIWPGSDIPECGHFFRHPADCGVHRDWLAEEAV